MLWYKAWLETRWRFVLLAGLIVFAWVMPSMISFARVGIPQNVPAMRVWVGVHIASMMVSVFTAIFLAGSGVNSQTTYGASSGFHGSMFFTLSLPVTRGRLLFVRAGLGAIECGLLVAIMGAFTLYRHPGGVTALQALLYLARLIICSMAIYAFSTLLACLLDEMWQFTGATLALGALLFVENRFAVVAATSPLRGMNLLSYPLTAPWPWTTVVASLIATGLFMFASVELLRRKEY